MAYQSPNNFDPDWPSTIEINEHVSRVPSNTGLAALVESSNIHDAIAADSQHIAQEAQDTIESVHAQSDSSEGHSVSLVAPPIVEIDDSPLKKRKRDDDDDDACLCPICLDSWTAVGEHRICSLKCGHLFGLRCLLHWFLPPMNRICPCCKRPASKDDIHFIYAPKIVAVDAAEMERVCNEVRTLTRDKTELQIAVSKTLQRENRLLLQRDFLKSRIRFLEDTLDGKHTFPISKFETMLVWIPDYGNTYNPELILSRLARQNPGLDTHNWRIYNVKTCKGGQRLLLGVSKTAELILKSMNYEPYYGGGTVCFRHFENPADTESSMTPRWLDNKRPRRRYSRGPPSRELYYF